MKGYHQILPCLILLVISIKEGLSLKCYSCNSFTDDNCTTVTPFTHIEVCSENQTLCRKVEQQLNYNKEDHVRIFRQCATRGSVGSCDSRIGTYRFKSWYCHCEKDFCNESSHQLVPFALLLVPIIVSLFVVKIF